MHSDFVTNQEIIQAARRNLEQGPWDYLAGGSESETTMRRNRLGFDRLAFRPRVCVNVSELHPATSFLGLGLRIPVLLAPIGSIQLFAPEGAAASAKAAAEFGTVPVVSSSTEPRLEDTAAASAGPKIYQLYVDGDWTWIADVLRRVRDSGYTALCVTADTAVYSRRERPMLDRWVPPTRRSPANARYRAGLTWELLDRIRETAGLPFMLKGIATAEDAAIALDHGADAIWVSNHGGRQLDHGRATIDALPEIVATVGSRAEILLDGGVQRGSDVLKALALGAKAVAIGKLQGWGLAAAGVPGLVRVLEILEAEILVAMGLLGVTTVEQLGPAYLCREEAVGLAHEMSAFTGLSGERLV